METNNLTSFVRRAIPAMAVVAAYVLALGAIAAAAAVIVDALSR